MSKTFADVVPIQAVSSHKYTIDLQDEWCIGSGTRPDFQIDPSITIPMTMQDSSADVSQCQMAVTSPPAFCSSHARTCRQLIPLAPNRTRSIFTSSSSDALLCRWPRSSSRTSSSARGLATSTLPFPSVKKMESRKMKWRATLQCLTSTRRPA